MRVLCRFEGGLTFSLPVRYRTAVMNQRTLSPAGSLASGRHVSASGGLRASGLLYLGYAYVYSYPPMAGGS